MIDFYAISQINKEAKRSFKLDAYGKLITNRGKRVLFFSLFHIFPFIMAGISFYFEIKLSDTRSFIFNGIAIFVGLFFSLLLSIGSKIRTERNESDMDEDHFDRYKNNMKQISYIIMYIIQFGVYIFLFIFLDSIFKSFYPSIISRISMSIVAFLLSKFIIAIFLMLQRFYHTSKDELDNIFYKNPDSSVSEEEVH